MKLLFIAPSAYLLGGVQDWLFMLASGLRQRGHEITVGVPDGKFHRLKPYNQQYPGLNAIGFVNRTGTIAGRKRALINFLKANPADLVIGVNIADLYQAWVAMPVKPPSSRLVMTLHAIEADYFADIQEFASILDAIVTTNRLTEAMVKGLESVSERRIFYAPYGVTEGPIRSAGQTARLRIAWAGRLENGQKRVADLQPILRELDKLHREYSLSIAGLGPDYDELRESLAPWIEDGRVKFVGLIEKHRMPEFLAEHDVFLITSKWETGPIVAWEAMAAGLVVVSSNYVGSGLEKALIHESTALLYPIGDGREAAFQMSRLRDESLRRYLSDHGRSMALSRYSQQASLDAWEQAFERIRQLDQGSPPQLQEGRSTQPSGRLERLVGSAWSERLRRILPLQTLVPDPGSEWPHAIHHIQDDVTILNYAESVEKAAAGNT